MSVFKSIRTAGYIKTPLHLPSKFATLKIGEVTRGLVARGTVNDLHQTSDALIRWSCRFSHAEELCTFVAKICLYETVDKAVM